MIALRTGLCYSERVFDPGYDEDDGVHGLRPRGERRNIDGRRFARCKQWEEKSKKRYTRDSLEPVD